MSYAQQAQRRSQCLVESCQITSTIQPLRESQSPAFDYSAGERALYVGMASGVAAVAQGDQICRVIHAPRGTRNQMVNVRFAFGAEFAAPLTVPVVASENDRPHVAPMLFSRSGP